ncbi:MAG: SRPBCC family protein [Rhizobiales bacterium]|nr:hypothetical protein [Hyphomicrobiales bacterium]NRB13920.1 SRPBCC family protein [Hyphomicrobiales bacterium]
MELVCKVEINQSAQKVWQVITDIEGCDQYISGIKSVEIIDRPKTGLIGLKWRETRVMFGKEAVETMWITDCEENVYYQTRAENHGAIYKTILSIEELQDKVILTMAFSGTSTNMFVKIISSIISFMMMGSMRKMLDKDLSDIKQQAEKSA